MCELAVVSSFRQMALASKQTCYVLGIICPPWLTDLLHFVVFFHVASLFLYRVDNRKVGVDNKKGLELTNSTVFHRGRQRKSSRAGKQNNFFIFQPAINKEISPKNTTKHPVA